jgi:pseudouridine-5'-monophosphatase
LTDASRRVAEVVCFGCDVVLLESLTQGLTASLGHVGHEFIEALIPRNLNCSSATQSAHPQVPLKPSRKRQDDFWVHDDRPKYNDDPVNDSSNTPPPRIRAALFDMDGLLIDSEDLYTIVTNTILERYGRPALPWSIKAQLQGRPGPQAGQIFHSWAQLPISQEQFFKEQKELQTDLFPNCKPLPGVMDLLEGLKKRGVHMALATSSHAGNFELKSSHLGHLFKYFAPEHQVLGDDPRIPPGRGKPAPDIYLLALSTLNKTLEAQGQPPIKPEECLVFEDSVPGVESGRRAGMQAVWCPHPELLVEYKDREKEVLAGLTGEHKEDEEQQLRKTEVEVAQGKRSVGMPGELDDGWARLLKSLEDFPYQSYGLVEAKSL